MTNKELFSKLFEQTKPYKKLFFISLGFAILVSVLAPIRPYLLQKIIDKDIAQMNQDSLITDCILFFGLLTFESLFRYVFNYITSLFSQSIVNDLRQSIYNHILKMKLSFYDKTPIGQLTTRTINDVETINEVYSENLFTILSDLLTIVFVLSTMLYINVTLTLISLSTLPFLYFATYVFKEKTKAANIKIRNKIGELNAFTQEHFMGVKIIKSFVAEDKEFEKFDTINQEQKALNIKIVWYYSWFFPVLETLISISIGLAIAYIALYGFQKDGLSVGMISSFLLYINMLFRPLRFIADKFNSLQMGFVASERVFQLLDIKDEEPFASKIKPPHIAGEIVFDHVNFSYNKGTPILKDLSFTIPSGTSLAIVGATGSGKTSIISLLNRFYSIQDGSITIDATSIYDIDLKYLRSKISMVLQDVYLFSGTISENIGLENADITKEDIVEMAKSLDVHEFFLSLPNNYDFYIKERGASLSHGQLQIISLFRAVAKNPAILVLDEATSSIDSNTEFYIQKLISNSIKNKTSIIIAHRLSTVMKADKILVLDKGISVGWGTHDELIQCNSVYQNYFQDID